MTEEQTLQKQSLKNLDSPLIKEKERDELKENDQSAISYAVTKSEGFKFQKQSIDDVSCSNTWNSVPGHDIEILNEVDNFLSLSSSSSSSSSSFSNEMSKSGVNSFAQNNSSTAFFHFLVRLQKEKKQEKTLETEGIENGLRKEDMHKYRVCAEKGLSLNPKLGFNRPENSLALTFYTAEPIFKEVNKLLREGEGPLQDRFAAFLKWCVFLTNFTEAWRTLPCQRGITVYRGMSAPSLDVLLQWCTVGMFIRFDAYTSSSLDIGVAMQTKNHIERGQDFLLFKIKSRSGRLIQDFSLFPEEKEVVFRAGTTFKTVASGQQKLDGDTFYVIEIEEYFPQIGRKNVLWCETNFESKSVEDIYQMAEKKAGVTFFEANSTAHALNLLNLFLCEGGPLHEVGPEKFRIIQNMTRREKPIEKVLFPDEKVNEEDKKLDIEAGLKLVQLLWGLYRYQFPLCVFTSPRYLKDNQRKFIDFPHVLVTDSVATCLDFACFGSVEKIEKPLLLTPTAQTIVDAQVKLACLSMKKWTSLEQDVATRRLQHIDTAKAQLLTNLEAKLKTNFEIRDKSIVSVSAYEFSIPVFETKTKDKLQKKIRIEETQKEGSRNGFPREAAKKEEQSMEKTVEQQKLEEEEITQVAMATLHRTFEPNTFNVIVPKPSSPENRITIGFKVKVPTLFPLPKEEAAEVTVFLNASYKDPTQGVLGGCYQFDQKGWTIEKSWLKEARFRVVPLFDSSCPSSAIFDCGCIKLVFKRGVKGYSPTNFHFQPQLCADSSSLPKENQKKAFEGDELKRKLAPGTEVPRFRKDGTAATIVPYGKSNQNLYSVPALLVRPETQVDVYLQIQISN